MNAIVPENINAVVSDKPRGISVLDSDISAYLSEIKVQYSGGIVAKIPFTEVSALGTAFSSLSQVFQATSSEKLYKCVFPHGVTGALAQAKDGTGALGTILKADGGLAQARWVEAGQAAVAINPTTVLMSVAILGIAKQVNDIKQSQQEIISILERDKKNQLLADYDILSDYMENYRFYWNNRETVTVNLNQVKNIKRNADKDIRSYRDQLEDLISPKRQMFEKLSSSMKIGKILDRFVHYKLALHVMAFATYLEVMLSKNFQAEYLDKVIAELREFAFQYRTLYTECYDKIEGLKKEGIEAQVTGGLAWLSKSVGNAIGRIPAIKNGPVDEFLIAAGESIDAADRKRLEDTLGFFIKHKSSDLIPVAEHLDAINQMANEKTEVVMSDNVIYVLSDQRKAV